MRGTGTLIEGGFYLKARRIQEAEIMHAPPHVREIWDWLLMKAMFADGKKLKRGQVFTTYQDIRDGLAWRIGYRIARYSKNDCETAMNYLKKHTMVTTTKHTHGIVVTICKYEYYQNPKNYESYNETYTKHTRNIHDSYSKDKLDNNNGSLDHPKNVIKKERNIFIVPSVEQVTSYCKERKNFVDPQRFVDYYEANGWKVGKNPMRNWQAAVRTWEKNAVPKQTPQSEFI